MNKRDSSKEASMKKLFFCGALVVAIAASSAAVVEACGSKFLVGGKSSPRFARVLASIQPARILFYWPQDDETAEEDRWNLNLEKLLTDVGHTVVVTADADAFRHAAQGAEFDVLVTIVQVARQIKGEVESLLPDTAFLVVSHLPTRSEFNEVKREFGKDNVIKTPNTTVAFLSAIENSRRTAR
jgi:hypothetical protein